MMGNTERMGNTESIKLDEKITALRALLAKIECTYTANAPAAFASSFGAEDMVLLDAIARHANGISVFTLDTGRLPSETPDLIHRAQAKYGIVVTAFTPDQAAVEGYVERNGINGFYESVENRKSCCHIRKVEPLARALAGKGAWLTGLRREQAPSRADLGESEFDSTHQLTKFNPLFDWTNEDVWAYIRANDVPYNALHDRGYPSIGCEPCTRAVKPGEDARAGRWWWESKADQKECGLHVAKTAGPARSADFSAIVKYQKYPSTPTKMVNVEAKV